MFAEPTRPYAGSIIANAHCFALRVYIEDTDLGGVVYHANYLRFLERARSDALRALGIQQRAAIESGEGVYAVTAVQIKYLRPAKLEDDLIVWSQVAALRGASCSVRQRIERAGELLTEATVTLAFIGLDGRPRRQPAAWVEKLRRLEIET